MQFLKILLAASLIGIFPISGLIAQNVHVGEIAPSFQLERFDGGTLSLSEYAGTIVFINFLGSY
ncbi:redoxin domain-containing protein [candidate division KSB1 bacterium]|nr:redoxin domain-containing protein [candidate division KSB1 bacterium]